MKIHERTNDAGDLVPVALEVIDGSLVIDTRRLPEGALEAVMRKFGGPIEDGERPRMNELDALELGAGCTLRHVRHLSRFDVIARDYLIYEAPGREPLCAMATTVAGALDHLARAGER